MPKVQRSDRPAPASPASKSRTDLKRRGFLLTLGVGGAGAAAIAARSMSGGVLAAEPAVAPATDDKGYAATEHVRRYYRTMKV